MPIEIAVPRMKAITTASVKKRQMDISECSLIVDLVVVRCKLVNNTGGMVIDATTPMGETDVRIIKYDIGISESCLVRQKEYQRNATKQLHPL